MTTEDRTPAASQKRAAHPDFVPTFSLAAIRDRLPFRFPVPDGVAPSPKRKYRSHYRYRGYTELASPKLRRTLSPFEIALRLIDFSPLRDLLAQHYTPTAMGQIPFDPVSMFLVLCLRRDLDLSWRRTAMLVAGEHGARWRRLFGFADGHTPSASGLRYFRDEVGADTLESLCGLFIDLLRAEGLLAETSTFPGDAADRGVTISHDIMLHDARSNVRCRHVTDSCYQPAPRPCPARRQGKQGCTCTDQSCRQACQRATPLDREARLIHYDGRNKHGDLPTSQANRGRNVFGYASNPDRLIDDRFACAWTLRTGLHPANVDERYLFPASFAQLRERWDEMAIGEVLADAALGYGCCLDPIWDAGALRMVDIRAASGDDDPTRQRQRGYDADGHPLCIHGYKMQPNGRDHRRRRTKWTCQKVCLRPGSDGYRRQPPPDCPYQASRHAHGQTVNVGRSLPDGSHRLARDVPYGSDTWKQRYGRRNLSESRNGSLEAMGLKRLPCFGLSRGRKEIAVADCLVNLHTLARLVLQATDLAAAAPT